MSFNFRTRLLVIDSTEWQSVICHFVANFSSIENTGLFFKILTVRGAIADASNHGFLDGYTRPKQLKG